MKNIKKAWNIREIPKNKKKNQKVRNSAKKSIKSEEEKIENMLKIRQKISEGGGKLYVNLSQPWGSQRPYKNVYLVFQVSATQMNWSTSSRCRSFSRTISTPKPIYTTWKFFYNSGQILQYTGKIFQKTYKQTKFSKIYREPTANTDIKWQPVQSADLEFLHIAEDGLRMETNLLPERSKFWSDLNLPTRLHDEL